MSLDYASSLSPYPNKGKCGVDEIFDKTENVKIKCQQLATFIKESKSIVAITGAGISTSCGIPDFRGPKGIWTLEGKGEKPNVNVSFESAIPSFTHFALVALEKHDKLNFLITQNIDGLHHRSSFPLNKLAEIHGNMFMTKCNQCQIKRLTNESVKTVGLKPIGKKCVREKQRGICRGEFCDTILDWEDSLPTEELRLSELNCKKADLCLCLGTSLQIMPCGNFPLLTKKNNGKIVIINLQPTRMDKHSDLIINSNLDFVFKLVLDELNIKMETENKIIIRSLNTNITNEKYYLNIDNNNVIINMEEKKCLNFKIGVEPSLILIFTGKRKTGKDYSCSLLINKISLLNENIFIEKLTLSAPLKKMYAQENNINYEKLLDSSDFKEKYRKDMIKWGEEKRLKDPSYFCKIVVDDLKYKIYQNTEKLFLVWIITDARRHTDLSYFKEKYHNLVKIIRVIADNDIREKRGWIFTDGIDNAPSECDLDNIQNLDFIITNNNDEELDVCLENIIEIIPK